jgi:hypothetical protein
LHYWPSERCSTWHNGRELDSGQFCYPNTVDYYCSWMGQCNENGTACDCDEPTHRSSADRCASWNASPTPSPTRHPTKSPSLSPTMKPTAAATCNALDREFCWHRGYCSSLGDGCVCDDVLHYWPSERCSTWHNGRELDSGQFCYPNTVDYYCSWMGTCSSDGSTCVCQDDGHRNSADRCLSYSYVPGGNAPTPAPAPPAPTPTPAVCSVDGERGPCHNRGTCVSPTSSAPSAAPALSCQCDDPQHYWASESCATPHYGPELETGQCCTPGAADYYCSWMGTCDASGRECVCHDQHRSPADRCSVWYESAGVPAPSPSGAACPDLLSMPGDNSDKHNQSSDTASVVVISVVVLCCIIAVAVMAVIVQRVRSNRLSLASTAAKPHPIVLSNIDVDIGSDYIIRSSGFAIESPMKETSPRRQSSFNPLDKMPRRGAITAFFATVLSGKAHTPADLAFNTETDACVGDAEMGSDFVTRASGFEQDSPMHDKNLSRRQSSLSTIKKLASSSGAISKYDELEEVEALY